MRMLTWMSGSMKLYRKIRNLRSALDTREVLEVIAMLRERFYWSRIFPISMALSFSLCAALLIYTTGQNNSMKNLEVHTNQKVAKKESNGHKSLKKSTQNN